MKSKKVKVDVKESTRRKILECKRVWKKSCRYIAQRLNEKGIGVSEKTVRAIR